MMKNKIQVSSVVFISLALLFVGAPSSSAATKGSAKSPTGSTMKLSKFKLLNPNGDDIMVKGAGFDTNSGIYVALCKQVPKGTKPSSCGGGADLTGTSGASIWISSNPPAYGVGVAIPFTDSGEFTAKLRVGAKIGNIDCRKVQCAVYTRADHLRGDDRSSDLAIPVTFAKKGKPVNAYVPLSQPSISAAPSSTSNPTPAASTPTKEKNIVVATTSTGAVLRTAGMPPVLRISAPILFTVTSTSAATPIVSIDPTNTKGTCAVLPKENGYQLSATDGTQCVVLVTVPGNDRYETGIGIYPFIIQP